MPSHNSPKGSHSHGHQLSINPSQRYLGGLLRSPLAPSVPVTLCAPGRCTRKHETQLARYLSDLWPRSSKSQSDETRLSLCRPHHHYLILLSGVKAHATPQCLDRPSRRPLARPQTLKARTACSICLRFIFPLNCRRLQFMMRHASPLPIPSTPPLPRQRLIHPR